MSSSLKRFCPFVFLLLTFACTPNRPSYVLSEDQLEDVLIDYQLALAMAEVQSGDMQENRYVLTQSVLKKHGLTEADLDTSLLYWCRHSEKMVKICDRVTERITYMAETQGVERQEKNPYSFLTNEGDTANVWNFREGVVLIPNIVDNIYSFSIDADSTYRPGDNFLWAFKTQFLSSDNDNEAYALFSVQFENDSIVGTSLRISSNKQVEIRLNCPVKYQATPIRSINGTIYIPIRDSGFGVFSAGKFVLVRYHNLSLDTNPNVEQAKMVEVSDSSVVTKPSSDTLRVRQNPYDIKNEQSDERTIKIVRDKPIRVNTRRR
ncbi:MAG: DUF4296 domain-containing protein [Bacteroidaceae bacterium]|nr:DUF4296 domain-containing protein [Bacteroidaceae bacterium]